ncbi:MAG TPA: class I SAM-dependent RNA methyltransferase [Patescibacteria group bacterium]|nr:class I SAM-dependent RNA methyltransferase [Patescibacteria group bacterium]
METFTLELTDMANGGAALGRDENERVIFVPFGIPGETVRVMATDEKKRFAWGDLVEVLIPSAERIDPPCPHFGACGGCHFQHIQYAAQLRYKGMVVCDQLSRIGGFENIPIKPVLANPEPWSYASEIKLSPTTEGELGFWSPHLAKVIAIEACPITHPELMDVFQDIDLILEGLRKLTLRRGDGGAMLAVLEVEDVEPPALTTDFPISVALALPDGQAINLVGDTYLVQSVKGRDFRVSAGAFFYPSPPATALLLDKVIEYAALQSRDMVVELYSGVGAMTAFLAEAAHEVIAIEVNADAVADTAINLATTDNVTLYEGKVEEILPLLTVKPNLMVVDPPHTGLPPDVVDQIVAIAPDRLIYVSSDLATLARDARRLKNQGYVLLEVQPIDMHPQTHHMIVVTHWAGKP